jgi:hypothetical protein
MNSEFKFLNCACCNKEFKKCRIHQKYCSKECKSLAHSRRRAPLVKAWKAKNPDYFNAYQREVCRAYRLKILKHYGGSPPKCACCGENEYKFLCIDHINGKGNEHRRELTGHKESSTGLYRWLINNNYPLGFQVLCYNCNNAKGHYGKCPHQEVKVNG